MPISRIKPLLTCAKCMSNDLPLEEMDVTDMTEGEVWDGIEKLLQPHGWTTCRVTDPKTNKTVRAACCPRCTKIDADLAARVHPPYNPQSLCSKCGHDEVSTLYNAGIRYSTYNPHDYLLRTCKRCGYTWNESPLAKPPSRSRQWLTSFFRKKETAPCPSPTTSSNSSPNPSQPSSTGKSPRKPSS